MDTWASVIQASILFNQCLIGTGTCSTTSHFYESFYPDLRSSKSCGRWRIKSSSVEKFNHGGRYVDKQGKMKSFNNKKFSRKRGGGLRSRGWKFGSGFIDGIFPVLSPIASKILEFIEKEVDSDKIWESLDTLPRTHTTWDDIINVAVQLRLSKRWDSIILVRKLVFYLH
uniref:Uncharacterized protein n=1 Tax=Opuntia streptacantha TaxID=393608 RepID=A0A7C9CTI9_OPUST